MKSIITLSEKDLAAIILEQLGVSGSKNVKVEFKMTDDQKELQAVVTHECEITVH